MGGDWINRLRRADRLFSNTMILFFLDICTIIFNIEVQVKEKINQRPRGVDPMIYQRDLRKAAIHKRSVLGAHPIIQFFVETLKVTEIIGSYIKQDSRLSLGVEKTTAVLIHNILTTPMPLYEIADWLAPLDEESLGLEPGEGAFLHDDRVGKALDCFYEGRHKDVFFHLALKAIKIFKLDCSQIHQDTTSITFSGKYAGWSAQERIAYGKNKDHRPDLKQLVLGMSITADGAVPLVHQVYDGNQTDDRLHPANHQKLRRLLKRSDFVYVADCKLATDDNLAKITACGGRFVSVMPRTWKEDAWFRRQVQQGKIEWKHLLSRANNRKPDSKKDRYDLACGEYKTSQGYSLLWIHSTQKAEQDAETRTRHIQKALEELGQLQAGLNRYNLKNRQAIDRKTIKILKENLCQPWIRYQISTHQATEIQFPRRGRPRPGEWGTRIKSDYFSISFEVDQEAVRQESLTDGVFPLINNVHKDHSPRKILEIYKFQPFLEKRHSQLKTWQEITPVLLKKSERVVALLHVHVMALMVATLIERKLRIAMKQNSIPSLPLYPEDRPCPYPTTFDLVRLFRGVEKYEVQQGDNVTLFPAQLTPIQKQVLKLLEVPLSLYQ